MKSLFFLFLIAMVTLGSCSAQKSNKEKLIGKWTFVEGWYDGVEQEEFYPKKSDSIYEKVNGVFRNYYKHFRFFYDGKDAGYVTVDDGKSLNHDYVDNDTVRKYPITFINDSTYKVGNAMTVIHFEGNNTFIMSNPDMKEYTKWKRED